MYFECTISQHEALHAR